MSASSSPNKKDLARRTLELVSVDSVTGQEEALANQVQEWALEHFGSRRVSRWRHGIVVAPAVQGPCLALVGHLDTVPPAEPQPLKIDGDRVYGCGASDMKAGVAVMMALMEQSHKIPVCGVFYDQEEGPQSNNGLMPLLELAPKLDLAIVLEPTDNEVQVGCVGSLHAQVEVLGQRAHSARPWHGESAVSKAIPLLQKLADWKPVPVEIAGQTFFEVATVTQAHTESPRNAVPGRFHLNINYRFAPGRSAEEAEATIREFLAGADKVIIEDVSPSGAVCLDHPRLAPWIEGRGLKVCPKQAWTDVAQLTQAGIPAVNFGPGTPAQAHQAGEWADIDQIWDNYQHLLALLN